MGRYKPIPLVRSIRNSRLRTVRAWAGGIVKTLLQIPRRSGLGVYYFFMGCPEGCQHYWSDWLSDEDGALRYCEKCGEIDII